ncbi:MAG: antibiotic biosynthesis monooxygenase [Pseudomonadota bacterium]
MYLAMNRFKVTGGHEKDFEDVWRSRDSSLKEMAGFVAFHLMRGAYHEEENYTLFASHTVWESEEDFVAWTKSENFRNAHKNAGNNSVLYQGHPQFEGFNAVDGA